MKARKVMGLNVSVLSAGGGPGQNLRGEAPGKTAQPSLVLMALGLPIRTLCRAFLLLVMKNGMESYCLASPTRETASAIAVETMVSMFWTHHPGVQVDVFAVVKGTFAAMIRLASAVVRVKLRPWLMVYAGTVGVKLSSHSAVASIWVQLPSLIGRAWVGIFSFERAPLISAAMGLPVLSRARLGPSAIRCIALFQRASTEQTTPKRVVAFGEDKGPKTTRPAVTEGISDEGIQAVVTVVELAMALLEFPHSGLDSVISLTGPSPVWS